MANSREREEFSKRLKQALRNGGVEADSPTRLAEEFSARYAGKAVTQQAARKWLNSEAIPSQDKIQALAVWLGVGTEWLRFGKEAGAAHGTQQLRTPYRAALTDQELLNQYHKLSRVHQQAVSEIISALTPRRKVK